MRIWDALDALNSELAAELENPLRIGIGLHFGEAVISKADDPSRSFQFLGNTGNVAAKLEAEANRLQCTLVASADFLSKLTHQFSHDEMQPGILDGYPSVLHVSRFYSRPAY